MAGRLSPRAGRGALGLGALTLAVIAAHLLLLRGAQDLHDRWMPETPEPDRLEAAFVRELRPADPPKPPQGSAGKEGTPPPRLASLPPSDQGVAPLAPIAPMPPDEAASRPPPPELQTLVAPSALADSDVAGDFIPGVEWPLSTELDYTLSGDFRGAIHGDARVQWLRSGSHYQVHLEAWVGPSFAPLMSRRLSSDGEITPSGLVPKRFDEVTGGLVGGKRQATLVFDLGGVRLADGRREPVPDGTQDAASQFVQLTWMFLTGRQAAQNEDLIQLSLALPRNVHLWRYRIRGLEDVVTPMGPIPAWHVDSDMVDTRGDMQAEFWLAPSLQFLPVRVRIWQDRPRDPRTHIDLVLKRPPRQAMEAAVPASGAASGAPAGAASSPL